MENGMNNTTAAIEEWKKRFKAVGLSDEQMIKWHKLFEAENPSGHQSFLEWLGASADLIEKIRREARQVS